MHSRHICSAVILFAITSLAVPLSSPTENVADELDIVIPTGKPHKPGDQYYCFLKRMAKPPLSEYKDPPPLGPYC